MLTQEQIDRYEQDGFLVLQQLLTLDECRKLKIAVGQLIDNWEPDPVYSWIFLNDKDKQQARAQRMVALKDELSFGIEEEAIDPQTGKLNRDKHLSLNRIGLTLHNFHPEFNAVTFSDKIKAIVHDLKFIKPAIRQTMYIFKQPFIGAKVASHRDSTYVYNEPLKIVGIWIALEDATINNGCLWFIPGSNLKPTQRRYIRNPNQQEFNEGKVLIFTEEEQYDDSAFVPVEIKAGRIVE
ncbi:unnamed protein product [Didymodactylos carnosus]|uniref:Phytanoyl-CoA dioxygenase n=1 Tax=Didymodactylos carnosus TaxID=1234261 RepID=A0A815QXV8_9BILA|nr:unnamed protein product [Didymodactylos carnosus]CAF1469801.1 unnamed protein product [Didymodactylos carnosus]CAF3988837.1 unnamed protein product [Didymodactylos carnosus]CAF4337808.1 unnamed protein product [Didymodactylos carnosus]